MGAFTADDGTRLGYRTLGDGEPLLCLPGGPMQDSAYLGDLGGLDRHRRLVLLDLRGTGTSDVPADPGSYRCGRQVADVEALRRHLGLERVDVLGHSAGTNLALAHAAAHPDRVRRLVLVTPSARAVGVEVPGATRLAAARLRSSERWFGPAMAALEAIAADEGQDWEAIAPFGYGRWDDAARAHQAAEGEQVNAEAAQVFGSDGAFDPVATRAALATLPALVLLLLGEVDLNTPAALADTFASLLPRPEVVVQRGAAHVPWLDDPAAFRSAVADVLDRPA